MRLTLLLVSMATISGAQEFELAAVKPAQRPTPAMINSGQTHFGSDAARFEATNSSLHDLIAFAYGIKWDYVSGPDWTDDQYFAVMASLPAHATQEQVPAMLQKLLADRFKLAVHRDQKVQQVYEMVVDKNGVKLQPTTADESQRVCMSRPGECFCRASTFTRLAEYLSGLANFGARMMARAPAGELLERRVDRPVVDQTGLAGNYDIDLQWVPPQGLPEPHPEASADYPPRNRSVKADSIFGAVEAIGLKLQPTRHAFDILVIDHVERVPTEN